MRGVSYGWLVIVKTMRRRAPFSPTEKMEELEPDPSKVELELDLSEVELELDRDSFDSFQDLDTTWFGSRPIPCASRASTVLLILIQVMFKADFSFVWPPLHQSSQLS